MAASALQIIALAVRFLSPLDADHKSELLEACSSAFEGGDCLEITSASENSELQASVEASDSEHFFVEFRAERIERQIVSSRQITFLPEDAPIDRARSLGLTLGVLANAALKTTRSKSEMTTDKPKKPKKPKDVQKRKRKSTRPPTTASPLFTRPQSTRWYLGVSGGLDHSPGWDQAGPSFDVHTRLLPQRALPISFLARLSMAYLPGSEARPQSTYYSGTGGMGWLFELGRTELHLALEAGVEYASFSLQFEAPESATEGGDWKGVGRAGVDYLLPLSKSLFFQLSPAATLLFSPTEIYISGEEIGSTGLYRLILRGGFTWSN